MVLQALRKTRPFRVVKCHLTLDPAWPGPYIICLDQSMYLGGELPPMQLIMKNRVGHSKIQAHTDAANTL